MRYDSQHTFCFMRLNVVLQYITWVSDGKPSWTLNAAGIAADPSVEISARPVPQEPMVILAYFHDARMLRLIKTVHHNKPRHVEEFR